MKVLILVVSVALGYSLNVFAGGCGNRPQCLFTEEDSFQAPSFVSEYEHENFIQLVNAVQEARKVCRTNPKTGMTFCCVYNPGQPPECSAE
jgi:hypothetical protein